MGTTKELGLFASNTHHIVALLKSPSTTDYALLYKRGGPYYVLREGGGAVQLRVESEENPFVAYFEVLCELKAPAWVDPWVDDKGDYAPNHLRLDSHHIRFNGRVARHNLAFYEGLLGRRYLLKKALLSALFKD
jgi:hypothetical protein